MSDVYVLQFSSPTCGPCQTIKPSLEMIREEFEDKLTWMPINIKDDRSGYTAKFGIQVVPTTVVMKGNIEIGRYSGTQIAIIYQLIRKALAA